LFSEQERLLHDVERPAMPFFGTEAAIGRTRRAAIRHLPAIGSQCRTENMPGKAAYLFTGQLRQFQSLTGGDGKMCRPIEECQPPGK
jgi:hypothetical protein